MELSVRTTEMTDNSHVYVLVTLHPPVPVSRIVFRLVHAHNDGHIRLRDKENADVVGYSKTAR